MQTEARAECLTSLRRRAQSSAPRIVGDVGGHVPNGATRPHRSRGSQWASFEAAQTYRPVVSRLVVSSLRSAAPDRKSFARVTRAVRVLQVPRAHLFSGAVARLPRTQPRQESPFTGGDRAEHSDASPAPLCRRRGFCQALTVLWRSGMGEGWDHQRPDRDAISRRHYRDSWRHYRKEALLVLTCSLSPPGPESRKRCLEEGAFGLYPDMRHADAVRKRSR